MIKRPDEYGHNNPDYAIADSDSVRGGGRVVPDLAALYALSTKADQLKVRVTRVWVTSEAKYYVLKDMANVGNSGGWEVESTGGGDFEPKITKSTGLLSWTGSAWAWIANNFIPGSRKITINGTQQDLSNDRSWTIATGDMLSSEYTGSGATKTVHSAETLNGTPAAQLSVNSASSARYDHTGKEISTYYASNAALGNKVDKNGTDRLMTVAEGDKLAGINNHYRGTYLSYEALVVAIPFGNEGDEAIVDAVGIDPKKYIWDDTDNVWALGTGTSITVDQSIIEGSVNAVSGGSVFSALLGKISTSLMGVANGVATLGSNGRLKPEQMPDISTDVIDLLEITSMIGEIFYMEEGDKVFDTTDKKIYTYISEVWSDPATPESDKLYLCKADTLTYKWNGTTLEATTSPLPYASSVVTVLGQSASTVTTPISVYTAFKYWVTNVTFDSLTTNSKKVLGAINELRSDLSNIDVDIPSNSVTNLKLAQVPTATMKGRTTAGTGDVEDLTAAQALALIGAKSSTYQGEFKTAIVTMATGAQSYQLPKSTISYFDAPMSTNSTMLFKIDASNTSNPAQVLTNELFQSVVYVQTGADITGVSFTYPNGQLILGTFIMQSSTTYKFTWDAIRVNSTTVKIYLTITKV